jgi:hypothetical protein
LTEATRHRGGKGRSFDDPASGYTAVLGMLEGAQAEYPDGDRATVKMVVFDGVLKQIDQLTAEAERLERKRKVGAKENTSEWAFAEELHEALLMLREW